MLALTPPKMGRKAVRCHGRKSQPTGSLSLCFVVAEQPPYWDTVTAAARGQKQLKCVCFFLKGWKPPMVPPLVQPLSSQPPVPTTTLIAPAKPLALPRLLCSERPFLSHGKVSGQRTRIS